MEAKQNLFDNTQFTGMAIFISAVIVMYFPHPGGTRTIPGSSLHN